MQPTKMVALIKLTKPDNYRISKPKSISKDEVRDENLTNSLAVLVPIFFLL